MTNQEQKTINQLHDLIRQLQTENNKFRDELSQRVLCVENKVEQKHLPLTLEKSIEHSINDVLIESLKKTFTGYNSPLEKYANNVIGRYQKTIEDVFDKIVSNGINTPEFENSCKEELLKKIVKTVISGIDGSVDKVINQMKQDSVFRSKLTLAVNTLVTEFLNNR